MALVRQIIPAFYGGVSQQSPTVRSPIQCEDADNCHFTVAHGASKRQPMEFRRRLNSEIDFDDAAYIWTATEDRTDVLVILPKASTGATPLVFRLNE